MPTILVVDDSPTMRKMIIAALRPTGATFLEAATGLEAIERLALTPVDLITRDLNMPDMHGIEVIHQLKKTDPQAKIIVGTTDIQDLSVQEALEAGALRVVPKPFTTEAFKEALRDVLSC